MLALTSYQCGTFSVLPCVALDVVCAQSSIWDSYGPSGRANMKQSISCFLECINHFSTAGRNCGTPLRDACVRQACLPAIATSSFKIFLTQSFPRRGATCYILPWRAMSRLFNGVNFGYRSADVYRSFQTYLGVLVRIRYFHNGELRWRFYALCFRPFIR